MRFLRMFIVLCGVMLGYDHGYLGARKIESAEIDFLMIALESLPQITAKLKLTKRNSMKVYRLIKEKPLKPSFSHKEIAEHLKEIIDPVKTFFNEIREFKVLVLGLIKNSLIDGKEQHHDAHQEKAAEKNSHENKKAHKPDKDNKAHEETKVPEPFLMKFINASLDIEKFVEHEITTQDHLKKICLEFIRFITDIEDSLTPASEKSFQEFMKKLKGSREISFEHRVPDLTQQLEAIWNETQKNSHKNDAA